MEHILDVRPTKIFMLSAPAANRGWQLALLLAVCLAWPASAAPKTRIRLVLSAETARAGDTVWAGLKMDMPPSWHVYWRYGGDAGDPVKITWRLPDGVSAGPIHWPMPEKEVDKAGDFSLTTYIYTHQVVLLTPIRLAVVGAYASDRTARPCRVRDTQRCMAKASTIAATVMMMSMLLTSTLPQW